ncbi:Chaperone SurA [Candidatus Hepatincola sp. Av]
MFKPITLIYILIIFLLACLANLNSATNNMLAVVNNTYVIFEYDVDQKIKFMELTTADPIYKSKDIRPLVLNQLINNYLILKDAKQFKVKVSAQEVSSALESIEKKLKIPKNSLLNEAKAEGLSHTYVLQELQNELTVEKTKKGIAISRSVTSSKEIEAEVQRTLNLNGKNEYLLSQIAVYIDNKTPEDAKKKIDLIYKSLHSYKDFATAANHFSEDFVTNSGGDIGWVPEVYLPQSVSKELVTLTNNQFTKPILINNYYKIFLLRDKRPLLYLDPNNSEHMKQLHAFVRQKLVYEKSKVALDDYLKETYNNASITFYNK